MKNEAFNLESHPPKMIIHRPKTVMDNLNRKIKFIPHGSAGPGPAVIGPACRDEDMRERYRI
jgi:hypothetical protein